MYMYCSIWFCDHTCNNILIEMKEDLLGGIILNNNELFLRKVW